MLQAKFTVPGRGLPTNLVPILSPSSRSGAGTKHFSRQGLVSLSTHHWDGRQSRMTAVVCRWSWTTDIAVLGPDSWVSKGAKERRSAGAGSGLYRPCTSFDVAGNCCSSHSQTDHRLNRLFQTKSPSAWQLIQVSQQQSGNSA